MQPVTREQAAHLRLWSVRSHFESSVVGAGCQRQLRSGMTQDLALYMLGNWNQPRSSADNAEAILF